MSNETGGSLAEWPAYPAVAWIPAPAPGSAPDPVEPPAAVVDEPVPVEEPVPTEPPPAVEPSPAEPVGVEPLGVKPLGDEAPPAEPTGPASGEPPPADLPDAEPGALFPAPEPQGLDGAQLRAALEAVLLVVDEPVSEAALADVIEQPADRVAAALDELSAEYTDAGRGFDLRRAAGGWRLYTRPEQAPYVERFILDGQQARLTQAALETLAVIAYRQPVTRSRISAIRGVNCDGVVRTLMTRGLVEESGTEPESGAHLYRTTGMFLEKLGLDSLDQLPPLAPFLPDDFEALDPDAPDHVVEAPAPDVAEPEVSEAEVSEAEVSEAEPPAAETPEPAAAASDAAEPERRAPENPEPDHAPG